MKLRSTMFKMHCFVSERDLRVIFAPPPPNTPPKKSCSSPLILKLPLQRQIVDNVSQSKPAPSQTDCSTNVSLVMGAIDLPFKFEPLLVFSRETRS